MRLATHFTQTIAGVKPIRLAKKVSVKNPHQPLVRVSDPKIKGAPDSQDLDSRYK